MSSGWHDHIQALTRSRQLLSERVTTRVPLAEIRGPFQELGRAALGRKGDARRDEQRGVAVVLSSGVAEDPLRSFSAAMRIAPMAASGSASVSGTLGSAPWISATIDGVASFGVCSFSVSPRFSHWRGELLDGGGLAGGRLAAGSVHSL